MSYEIGERLGYGITLILAVQARASSHVSLAVLA